MSEINTWPGWENVELLGEGSFGKVYKIRREEYGMVSETALKVITIPGSQADLAAAKEEGMDDASVTNYFKSFVEDLAAEFALMSSLKGNSNIVSYEDHMVIPREGEVGWDILIRMELLTPLQAAAAKKPLTGKDVAILGIDMCRALTLCRNRGIIHRDIKPENIFLSKDGNYKLGDFGVARVAEKTVSVMSRKGTYSYMAPEVYKSEKYGFEADIYSLGIVLYRYLNNNRLPFLPPYPAPIQYSDRENALSRRIGGEALPMPENGGEALKRAVLKACAYRVEDRYDSAERFMADLESTLRTLEEETTAEAGSGAGEGFPAGLTQALQEKSGADEFDRTMSAVALGQAARVQPADVRKNDIAAINVPESNNDLSSGIHISEVRPAEDNLTTNPESGKKPGKKSGKKKFVPIVAALGVLALVLAAFGIKTGSGGRSGSGAQSAKGDTKESEAKNAGTEALAMQESEAARAQAMQEALAMLETPTDAAWLESHKAAVEAFDKRLPGTWEYVGEEQNGEKYVSGLSYKDLNILETGEFYLKYADEWLRLAEEQIPLPVMTAMDGTTDFLQAAKSVYDDGKQSADNIYTLMPSISDLSVTYELLDYEVEEDHYEAKFYNNREDDGLIIRIQGNYQDGPLTVKTIDTSIAFIRHNFMRAWFFPSIEGRWTDNNGYIWAFRVAREPVEGYSSRGGKLYVAFAMKDSTGQIHEGKEFRDGYNSDMGAIRLSIAFQDKIAVPSYTLISYDGMTLELEGEDGSKLILTRS